MPGESSEIWASLERSGHWPTNTIQAMDRMASALSSRPELLEQAGAEASAAFVEVLALHVESQLRDTLAVNADALRWVTLANSVVALQPSLAARMFAAVYRPTAATWRAGLRYLAALGYPTPDHPWRTEPIALWSRFGDTDGVCWTDDAALAHGRALAPTPMAEALAAIAQFAADNPEAELVATTTDELCLLQLPQVWGARVRCLRSRLIDRDPLADWDDEMGIDHAGQ